MFNVELFSVRDVKTGFKSPFISASVAYAQRGFCQWIQSLDPEEPVPGGDALPSDLSLYHLGTMDIDSGTITPCMPPEIIS